MKPPPTLEQFAKYQAAWEFFNKSLFGGKLRPCLLNFSRHRGSYGFFTPNRWTKASKQVHEISLNPDRLDRTLEEVFSTLAHEMCHQWQFDFGENFLRSTYHDTEWAEKMVEVGLIPSDTGEPGGKPTGQKVSHYIDPQGRFIKAVRKMPKDVILPWRSIGPKDDEKPKKPRRKKQVFICLGCRIKIWCEKPDLNASCEDCGERFLTPEELKEELLSRGGDDE